MPIYVALLRGVNMGPHKRMKMDRLRASFEALGFEQVQTYIQSGNVIFKAAKASPQTMAKKIEDRILADFGFPAPVVIRTQTEMERTIAGSPFIKRKGIDPTKLHIIFLRVAPDPTAMKELANLTTAPDESLCAGREIYLHLPNGMSKSTLMNNSLERRHLKGATTRNWQTVNNISDMCRACG